MKIKSVKLEWYAFRYSNEKLVFVNVLNGIEQEIAKKVKGKSILTKKDLKEWLKRDLMYYFWCKAEHEFVIGDVFTNDMDKLEKHDIWWQLEPNLDRITEYVNSTMELGL